MKKKLDLFGLKAYDEKIDNEDKELSLQDQFFSQSVKHLKQCRKDNKRYSLFVYFFSIALLLIILIASICSIVTTPDIQANAAEEAVDEADSNYKNYTIAFSNAPIHFYLPNANQVSAQLGYAYVFRNFYLYSQQRRTDTDYTTMLYQFIDKEGRSYGTEILQVGMINYLFLDSNLQQDASWRNIAQTTSHLSEVSTFSTLYNYENYVRLIKPNNLTWSTTNRFTVNISVPTDYVVNLEQCKIRACNLVDYMCYPNNDDIWYNYSIVNSSTGGSQLVFAGTDASFSQEPLYPVAQDYNSIYNNGYNVGYTTGYNLGESAGEESGYNAGYSDGERQGSTVGYNQGYNAGVLEANDYSFLSLMTSVVDAPVTVIRNLVDFDLLGFNMSNLLFSLLTVCLVLALIKLLL